MAKNTNTQYDDMEFEPYSFKEFPMAVPVVDGKVMESPYNDLSKSHPVVIVHNQTELDALMGEKPAKVIVDPQGAGRVEGEQDIRKALYIQAEQSGAQIDKRWPVARIEQAIKDHVAGKSAAPDVV